MAMGRIKKPILIPGNKAIDAKIIPLTAPEAPTALYALSRLWISKARRLPPIKLEK